MERQPAFVDVEIVAHRAGNSVAGTLAARVDADQLIEADVHFYQGRAEVRHAKVLRPTRRMWDGRRLCPAGTTGVPLPAIVAAAGGDAIVMADLKCSTWRAAQAIRANFPEQQRLVVTTRNWWVLRSFRGRPHTRLVRSCGNRPQLWCAQRMIWPGSATGFAVHERHVTTNVVERLLAKSDLVYAWGATTVDRCHALVAMGVTGLILDDPAIVGVAPRR